MKLISGGGGSGVAALTDNGTVVTSSEPILLPDGSVGAPSLSWTNNTNYGFWRDANGIEWSANGVNYWRFGSQGELRINGNATGTVGGLYIDNGFGTNVGQITRNSSGGLSIQGNSAAALLISVGASGTGINLNYGAGASTVTIGGAASAAPAAKALTIGESSRGGTDSNIAGTTGTLQSGLGTGNSTPSTSVFKGPNADGATGTTAQTQVIRMVLNATKALTTGAATTLVSIPLASLAMCGGYVSVYMEATDGTSQATRAEEIYYAGENSAGVFVVSTGVVGTGVTACTAAKTLTATYALTGANPALLQVTPTLTGITATRFTCIYEVHHMGQTAPTV